MIVRRWLKDILGRWRERRIRTKRIRNLYRIIDRNKEILNNGGRL